MFKIIPIFEVQGSFDMIPLQCYDNNILSSNIFISYSFLIHYVCICTCVCVCVCARARACVSYYVFIPFNCFEFCMKQIIIVMVLQLCILYSE